MATMTPPASLEEMLSLEKAADELCVSKSTLYRMLERKEVKGCKVGRQWRFSRADLLAYLNRGSQAVVLETVGAAEVDALLPSLAAASQRLGCALPTLEPTAMPDAKVAAYVQHLAALAATAGASDIHLAPERQQTVVQVRIDGVLQELCRLPAAAYPAVIAQMKQLAGMNVDERAVPQDGRFNFSYDDRRYDARVNVMPTVFGEALVMRILNQSQVLLGLPRLGFDPEDVARLERWLRIPSGLILATGPTGSGRTTTLYSCLQQVVGSERSTLTVEDPVEYLLPHTRQTSVNRRAGLTFATALRGFLRQDPDIILVGEMRDLETAEIVMQAALTGHLVFSTLLPHDGVSTLTRLIDMGIAPFLVGGALHGIVAQRLARQLCPHCKAPAAVLPDMLDHVRELAAQGGYLLPEDAVFYQGAGCAHCWHGYRGRLGLFSLLEVTPAVREAVLKRAPHDELTRLAVAGGMRTLFADGIRKAVAGLTTVDEVIRLALTE